MGALVFDLTEGHTCVSFGIQLIPAKTVHGPSGQQSSACKHACRAAHAVTRLPGCTCCTAPSTLLPLPTRPPPHPCRVGRRWRRLQSHHRDHDNLAQVVRVCPPFNYLKTFVSVRPNRQACCLALNSKMQKTFWSSFAKKG